VDPLASARLINALLFGLTIYVSGCLIWSQLTQAPVYAWLGTAAVLASPALFGISVMAYTEPLFVFLTVLFLLGLEFWIRNQKRLWSAVLVLAAALACMTRYAGITLVLTGGLTILLLDRERWKRRIVHAVVFGLLSILPVSLWMVRNLTVSGTLFGTRSPAAYGLIQILRVAFSTFTSWYVPQAILASRALLFILALAIGFLAGFRLGGERPGMRALRAGLGRVAPLLLFSLIYLAFMVLSSLLADVAPLDDRLLSPVYVPVTLLMLLLARELLLPLGQGFSQRFPNVLAVVLVGLWLLLPLRGLRSSLLTGLKEGWGYSGRVWRDSPIVQYLGREPLLASGTVYSNGPDVLYFFFDRRARMAPASTSYANGEIPLSSPIASNLPLLSTIWPGSGTSYLVWFDRISDRHYLFPVRDLQQVADLQLVRRFQDGAIYRVSPKP
jgi:4-amino-4-deoxy-L-arabinose transferase-like glycosyltransferase